MRRAFPKLRSSFLPGGGAEVGGPITSDRRVAGVCFTGSTETAQLINRTMADNLAPDAPLIAETGGLNAMIVDSTALPEQAVRDILASAFQSAGQRCSALRMLYVQEDVADRVIEMLTGAMGRVERRRPVAAVERCRPGDRCRGKGRDRAHCDRLTEDGRLLKRLDPPDTGRFVPPSVFRLDGIEALEREIFGPVLHVATFGAEEIDQVVDAVNARGYGLTFGLHTRVDARVQRIVDRVDVGNVYVNRNQIGAVVGSQPFGGEGLSGTGPKAGRAALCGAVHEGGGSGAGIRRCWCSRECRRPAGSDRPGVLAGLGGIGRSLRTASRACERYGAGARCRPGIGPGPRSTCRDRRANPIGSKSIRAAWCCVSVRAAMSRSPRRCRRWPSATVRWLSCRALARKSRHWPRPCAGCWR